MSEFYREEVAPVAGVSKKSSDENSIVSSSAWIGAQGVISMPIEEGPLASTLVRRLRAEAEASEEPSRKAVLLHEVGELEERVLKDELAAAREYLAAFNFDGNFREPLEALVRILERRRSLKNLGRVFESLNQAAD